MNRSGHQAWRAWMSGAAVVAMGVALPAFAGAPARPATVDVQKQAAQPRPGQVLPGSAPAPATVPTPPASGRPAPPPEPARVEDAPRPVSPSDEAPHVFPGGPAERRLAEIRAAVHDEPVGLTVTGQTGDGPAQWRMLNGEWTEIAPGGVITGPVEVRTGLFRSITLRVGEGPIVRVDRASHVIIRRVRVGEDEPDSPAPRRVAVELRRGRVMADPGGGQGKKADAGAPAVTVYSPDWITVAREPLEVTCDPGRATTTRHVPAR